MGTELKLTKARLDLLRAVERGEVVFYRGFMSSRQWTARRMPDGRSPKVDTAIGQLSAAGLVERDGVDWGEHSTPFRLTDAGRAAVAGEPRDLMRTLRDSLDAAKRAKVDTAADSLTSKEPTP